MTSIQGDKQWSAALPSTPKCLTKKEVLDPFTFCTGNCMDPFPHHPRYEPVDTRLLYYL